VLPSPSPPPRGSAATRRAPQAARRSREEQGRPRRPGRQSGGGHAADFFLFPATDFRLGTANTGTAPTPPRQRHPPSAATAGMSRFPFAVVSERPRHGRRRQHTQSTTLRSSRTHFAHATRRTHQVRKPTRPCWFATESRAEALRAFAADAPWTAARRTHPKRPPKAPFFALLAPAWSPHHSCAQLGTSRAPEPARSRRRRCEYEHLLRLPRFRPRSNGREPRDPACGFATRGNARRAHT
jgi:hypothetical protein